MQNFGDRGGTTLPDINQSPIALHSQFNSVPYLPDVNWNFTGKKSIYSDELQRTPKTRLKNKL